MVTRKNKNGCSINLIIKPAVYKPLIKKDSTIQVGIQSPHKQAPHIGPFEGHQTTTLKAAKNDHSLGKVFTLYFIHKTILPDYNLKEEKYLILMKLTHTS